MKDIKNKNESSKLEVDKLSAKQMRELANEKARAEKDEKNKVRDALKKKLLDLHKTFNIDSPTEFIKVYRSINIKPSTRAKITSEKRDAILSALKNPGQSTLAEIAQNAGVSVASVSLIKRENGLIRTKKVVAA